ncbi:unnamed protein product, partial [marine sediment metagenome]
FGKASFEPNALKENLLTVIEGIAERKPEEGLKGRYVKKVCIASTMGPGIVLDSTEVQSVVDAAS